MSTQEPKPIGRPPLVKGERAKSVTVRLPAALHDRACKAALLRGVSVSRVMRAALSRMVAQSTTDASA